MSAKGQPDSSTVEPTPTSAARRKSQPSSTVCAIPELFGNLSLLAVGAVDDYKCDDSAYNLKELCDMESVQYECEDIDSCSAKVEKIGMQFISKIINDLNLDLTVEYDAQAESFLHQSIQVHKGRIL